MSADNDRLTLIYPHSREWDAWVEHLKGTKEGARMLEVLAMIARKRARWLGDLLTQLLSSDIPTEDIKIAEHDGGRTTVAIRGVTRHEFCVRVPWPAPSPLPPAPPSADRLTRTAEPLAPSKLAGERRSIGDGELDAIAARVEARMTRDEADEAIRDERSDQTKTRDRMLAAALAATDLNQKPDVADADDLDVISVVDPNEAEALVYISGVRRAVQGSSPMRVPNAKPKMRLRVVSLRDDPVGHLAKSGHLGRGPLRDDRLKAARVWQAYYEKAEIGGARGIDPFQYLNRVDGGEFVMPETEQRMRAQQKLREFRSAIGFIDPLRIEGARLLEWVLGDKLSLAQVAAMYFQADRRKCPLLGPFVACLDVVAGECGITQEPRRIGPRPRRHDTLDGLARYADTPALYAAVNEARIAQVLSAVVTSPNADKPPLRLQGKAP